MSKMPLPKKVGEVHVFGTLFRDGMQTKKMNISSSNALKIVKRKAELGFHYAELGFVGANEFAENLIRSALKEDLGAMKVAAFARTRKANETADNSPDVQGLLGLGVPVAVIVCKSRLLDVRESLRTEPEINLAMIYDTVSYLKKKGLEVIVDLEHAMDAWCGRGEFGEDMSNRKKMLHKTYFIEVVEAAINAGADCIVVCDTNGGSSPEEVARTIKYLVSKFPDMRFGFHGHNDCGMAVANTRSAVLAGARHIQGVTNGYGERCGNANLIEVICRLQIKDKIPLISETALSQITSYSRSVAKAFNREPRYRDPYVGYSAFSTFAGMHASSEGRSEGAYLQCRPERVGNKAHVGLNMQSGRSNIDLMAKEHDCILDQEQLKKFMEQYDRVIKCGGFEVSETSFKLACLMMRGDFLPYFDLTSYKVTTSRENGDGFNEATIKVVIGQNNLHVVAEGEGAYDALSNTLKKTLLPFYPEIERLELKSFDLHALEVGIQGSKAPVRILAESFDNQSNEIWNTVGVSTDTTRAGLKALVDSIQWFLFKNNCKNLHVDLQ